MSTFSFKPFVRITIPILVITFLALLISELSWGWSWEATYVFEGNIYETKKLRGFPLPSACFFPHLNKYGPCVTVNWLNYWLNHVSALLLAATIYFFLLKRIRLGIPGKIVFATIALGATYYFFFFFMILHNVGFDYQGGEWPSNIELQKLSYSFRPLP
jgi:hypothetical protein